MFIKCEYSFDVTSELSCIGLIEYNKLVKCPHCVSYQFSVIQLDQIYCSLHKYFVIQLSSVTLLQGPAASEEVL